MDDERRQFAMSAAAPFSVDLPMAEVPDPATIKRSSAREAGYAGRQIMPLPTAILSDLKPGLRRAFTTELERGNSFLFAPVFMAAGALTYFALAKEPGFVLLFLCLGATIFLSAFLASRPMLQAVFLAAVMFSAGALAGKIETWRATKTMLGSQITTQLTGRVMRIEYQASGRVRLTLDVIETQRPVLRHVPARVRATARSIPEKMKPGDVVRGVVRLMPPSGPVRPHSYDFTFNSYFTGIGAAGFFMTGPQPVAASKVPNLTTRIAIMMEQWRGRMARHIENTIGGPEGAVAAALITGVRAGIPEEINEALRITGLYHIISISGLHMALVAGTLMVSLRAGFALFPTFSMRHPIKKYAAFFALCATAFYLIISGSDVAAQRSFIMLGVMLLAVLFDRAALTMRNLAISALIILAVAPHEVVGPSFQMSFAATAALVAAYAAWRTHREARPARLRARETPAIRGMRSITFYMAGLSMTSVVAGLATALFTAWHFQQVSPLSLVANLVVMPIVSVIVMPMAVLASLVMPLGLDGPPLWMMGQGIAAMNGAAIWLANYSAFDATGAIPIAAVMTLTVALALLTMSETTLRWFALPFVIIGVGLLFQRELPDAFVSEDGSLVALRLADGRIAVNRARPRAFTIDNWRRVFGGGEILHPVKVTTLKDSGTALNRVSHLASDAAANSDIWAKSRIHADEGFICSDDLCIASRGDGAIIVHAKTASAARPACNRAGLIIIADATAKNPCRGELTVVVTGRELARRGSIQVDFRRADSNAADEAGLTQPLRAEINFAITEPYRPWHARRQYSREARGLPPYQKAQGKQPSTQAKQKADRKTGRVSSATD